jgi:hypothetical protein
MSVRRLFGDRQCVPTARFLASRSVQEVERMFVSFALRHKKTEMKFVLLGVLLTCTAFAKAQNPKSLRELSSNDTTPPGKSVFYGNFIQRLGFTSGGFPQDIRIANVDTKEVFAFRVKPTFKSAKENIFCFVVEPGRYVILNYYWTESKWYGGKMFVEPIFKGVDATANLDEKVKSGQIDPNQVSRFGFKLEANSLNYLGTWHFDTGLVSFTNDKAQLDSQLKDKYQKVDLSKASIILPD